jgi:hypothetical protein
MENVAMASPSYRELMKAQRAEARAKRDAEPARTPRRGALYLILMEVKTGTALPAQQTPGPILVTDKERPCEPALRGLFFWTAQQTYHVRYFKNYLRRGNWCA